MVFFLDAVYFKVAVSAGKKESFFLCVRFVSLLEFRIP